MSLPADATDASHERIELARELVATCPPELGREVAVSGSVAHGVADDDSDIELNFWCDEVPPAGAREAWLREQGVEQLAVDQVAGADGTHWIICFHRSIQIEAGWQRVGAQHDLVRALAASEITDHRRLIVADTILRAMPLRGGELLAAWQAQLATYPDGLRERLIATAVERWSWPTFHRALARRGEVLALTSRLLAEVHAVLRILCALNKRWESDWKRLRLIERELEVAPSDLADRIDAVLTESDADRAIDLCFQLVRDTLGLLPSSDDVTTALSVIEDVLGRKTA